VANKKHIYFASLAIIVVVGCQNGSAPPSLDGSTPAGGNTANTSVDDDAPVVFEEVTPTIGDPVAFEGKVILPSAEGAAGMDVATLRISNGYGDVAVEADGSFRAESIVNLPGLTALVNANDQAILLGFVGPEGNREISVRTTAEVLMYLAIGGWTFPASRLPELLHEISNSPSSAQLAGEIERQLSANPTALFDGNEFIRQMLETSALRFFANAGSDSAAKRRDVQHHGAEFRNTTRVIESDSFLTITPGSDTRQSGVSLEEFGDIGVDIKNYSVRRGCFYVFQSAYEDADGTRFEISPVAQLGEVLDVPPAQKLLTNQRMENVIASFNDSAAPSFWVPAEAGPATVSPRAGALTTELTFVLLGPALDEATPPAILSEPAYVLLADEWKTKLEAMQVQALVLDFLVPLMETMSLTVNMGLFVQDSDPAFSLEQLVHSVITDDSLSIDTTSGFLATLDAITQRVAQNEAFRSSMIDAITEAYASQPGPQLSASRLAGHFRRIAELSSVQEAINMYGRFDGARRLADLQGASSASVWTGELGVLRLEPRSATVTTDNNAADFEVLVADSSSENLTFEWTTTGNAGELIGEDVNGTFVDGDSITSKSSKVEYHVPDLALIQNGRLDTVSVSVFADGRLLGSASAPVNGKLTEEETRPPTPPPGACGVPYDLRNTSSPFATLSVPGIVVEGGTLSFTVRINGGAIETFSLDPVSYTMGFAVSKTRLLRTDKSQLLVDGAPVFEPDDTSIDLRDFPGNAWVSNGSELRAASGLIRFQTDGETNHTITVPIDDNSVNVACGFSHIVRVSFDSNFVNRSGFTLPEGRGLPLAAEFFVLPKKKNGKHQGSGLAE